MRMVFGGMKLQRPLWQLPNILSVGRLLLSPLLLLTKAFSPWFYMLYLACGISDMADGWLARRWHLETRTGARLDSMGDMVFACVCLVKLLPALDICGWRFVWICAIALLRLAAAAIGYGKRRTLEPFHTLSNKLTGLALFLLPLLWFAMDQELLCMCACIMATLAALEELALQFVKGPVRLDRRGLFLP